jgi:hypothetical protein
MVYRVAVLSAVLLAGVGLTIPVYAGVSNIQTVKGVCASTSWTAEGPPDSDLTNRESRFYCDSAVITFFDDYKGHVMVQFGRKKSLHPQIISFAGRVEDAGIMMQVDSVYLVSGEKVIPSRGECKFFFKNRHLSGIVCYMSVDGIDRRTAAVMTFDLSPGQ